MTKIIFFLEIYCLRQKGFFLSCDLPLALFFFFQFRINLTINRKLYLWFRIYDFLATLPDIDKIDTNYTIKNKDVY